MSDKLIFGAAYYEEYLPEPRTEKDLMLMKQAGMNTVRIGESTWSVEEPREGEFDFSHVTGVIEKAAALDMQVIVGTPTYAIPAWLAAKDPDILGDQSFGPRQNMDITHPVYREHAERIIREIVSRTAPCPNVIGYQIDNETKHYGANSPRIRRGFQQWLQQRFGTIEKVNDAFGLYHWSNSVASFEELPDPAGSVNGSYLCAFEEYRRELATEFLAWQASIVREYKRDDQFITHNFDYEWKTFVPPGQQGGMSAGLQPDLNDYEVAKSLTLCGTDIYCPPGEQLSGREIAFGGDVIRSLKKAPYVVLESQAQAFPGWLPWPGQLRLMAMTHVASGADGLLYWPWLSIHNGVESYWKGVLSHDGEPGEIYDEIRRIGRELETLGDLVKGTGKENRIALIVSPEALHALRHFPTVQGQGYNDTVTRFYQALYELNLECDVLYDREEDWSGYDLLLFPEYYCCSDAMIRRVRTFTEEGGTVLATWRSFFADENLRIRHDRQPHGLTDVFGMHYSMFTRDEKERWVDLLEPDTARTISRIDHPCWNRYAAVTRNEYGRGHAWYLGVQPEPEDLKQCLRDVCRDADIPVPELTWPTVYKKRGKLRFLMNYSAVRQRIACPVAGRNVLTGGDVKRGEKIVLPEWGVMILEEEDGEERGPRG